MARNFQIFNKAFPGQKKYQLDKEKRSTRVDISLLPDTYFLTFIFNLLLIIAVLVFFFNTRNVSEEYFIRKNIINVFEKTSIRSAPEIDLSGKVRQSELIDVQPFSGISSAETFQSFMTTTIPYSIFTPSVDSNQLAFSLQNPPIGDLVIRNQHWSKSSCTQSPMNPIISPNATTTACTNEENSEEQMTSPLKI